MENVKPQPDMLGTGLAANAANILKYRKQYNTLVQDAAMEGNDFPAFDDWLKSMQDKKS